MSCINCCQWEPDGERVKCSQCGITRPKPVRRVCQNYRDPHALTPRYSPTLAPWRYLVALTRWAWHGFPRRDRREYLRVRAICEACPEWQPEEEACGVCGCGGKRKGPVWRDKLKMGTESCPRRKW